MIETGIVIGLILFVSGSVGFWIYSRPVKGIAADSRESSLSATNSALH